MTEHAFNKHGSKYVLRALQMLKEMGIRIALDDFGTGHSSFSHIMDYPLDCIKLDCDFVQRMNTEPAILAIVESIGILGQKLSIDIIAEGWKPSSSGKRCAKPVSISARVFCSAGRWNPSGCRAAAGSTAACRRPLNALLFAERRQLHADKRHHADDRAGVKVEAEPTRSHSMPAPRLASSSATPLTKLNMPNAVPRRCAGAVCVTIAANSPCVMPMCTPHSATPNSTPAQ